jgi:hypothetical protein
VFSERQLREADIKRYDAFFITADRNTTQERGRAIEIFEGLLEEELLHEYIEGRKASGEDGFYIREGIQAYLPALTHPYILRSAVFGISAINAMVREYCNLGTSSH